MIAEVEDYVTKRIEEISKGGQFEVSFEDGHGLANTPDRRHGLQQVVLTVAEQRELRRLCLEARYRGRVWARSWIDAVRNGWLLVIEKSEPMSDEQRTMLHLLRAAENDPVLAEEHPDRDSWLTWYEQRLLLFAPSELSASGRRMELAKLVAFFDAVFAQINGLGSNARIDVRQLAYWTAEQIWGFVVEGKGQPASGHTRQAIGRRESKARLTKRSLA